MDNPKGDEQLIRWLRRVLPSMVWMIAGLTVFFFVAAALELRKLNERRRGVLLPPDVRFLDEARQRAADMPTQ